MSDLGDDFRAWREWKRSVRSYWYSCDNCAIAYGTGTKVAPGGTCHRCGWKAPGERGSDVRQARKDQAKEQEKADNIERNRRLQLAARTCRTCGKVCVSKAGRQQHEQAKHDRSARTAPK